MAKTLPIIIFVILIIALAAGIFYFVKSSAGTPEVIGNNTDNGSNNENPPRIPDANTPKTYNINIENFEYSQKSLRIKKGDTVVWTNMDSVKHTATSDSENEIDSPLLSKDQTYSHTFGKTGTFNYHCTPHPNMKGEIIVE